MRRRDARLRCNSKHFEQKLLIAKRIGMASIKFVMEQHVGMRTFYKNMRHVVDQGVDISADWVEITYTKSLPITRRLNATANYWLGTGYGIAQTRRGLASNSAEVTFFCTQVPALLAGGALQRTPYVLCTDITPLQYDAWAAEYDHLVSDKPFIQQYKYARNRDCFQRAECVIAWSTWAAESLISDYNVSPERVEVVPPGVDLQQWRPPAEKDDSVFNVLFVGGDFVRKGGLLLLDVFKMLPRDRFALHVVTKAEVESNDNVYVYRDMVPNSAELIDLYQRAHAYVHPARAEAYGIAAVEAAASGLPVIASRVGGLKSIVDDGVTGHLLATPTADSIRDILLELERDSAKRRAMGNAARHRAEQFFEVNDNVQRVLAILKAAASGQSPDAIHRPVRGMHAERQSLPKRAIA